MGEISVKIAPDPKHNDTVENVNNGPVFLPDGAVGAVDDVQRIAHELLALSTRLMRTTGSGAGERPVRKPSLGNDQDLARLAKALYRSRRTRTRHITNHLFGEPGWDMLLDLFVRSVEGRMISVTSLSIAAAVPATTALRWIGQLETTGLLNRVAHPADARASLVHLTDDGQAAVRCALQSYADELAIVFQGI